MFVYIREKIPQIAILKCVGVKGRDAILIFLFQSFVMGVLGAVLGTALGVVIQQIFFLITDFLPVELQLFCPSHPFSGYGCRGTSHPFI